LKSMRDEKILAWMISDLYISLTWNIPKAYLDLTLFSNWRTWNGLVLHS
jgi:hypothetical protein